MYPATDWLEGGRCFNGVMASASEEKPHDGFTFTLFGRYRRQRGVVLRTGPFEG